MKITIALTKAELTALVSDKYLRDKPAGSIVELKIVTGRKTKDIFTQLDYSMFDEVRRLRSRGEIIAAIKCFRAHTSLGLAVSKYACENLDEYISVCRAAGRFAKNFMGFSSV